MMYDPILTHYEVRKSNKQKTAFIDYMKQRLTKAGYDPEQDIKIEEKGKGLFQSRNIVVGNPAEAKVLFGAHYDTCAWMPFPNFMAPTNPVLFWGYQVVLTIMILVLAGGIGFGIGLLCNNAITAYFAFLISLILIMVQMMVGFRNKHTANDNTSGIITLTHILETLPEDQRKKVCVIYFDNEEKGLLGSAFFYKKHKKQVKDKMLINIDCVGDGEHIVTMADRRARKDENYPLFVEVLKQEETRADVQYLCRKMKFMMFPSDQMNFRKGIGVCSLKKSPVGMYVARIHTYLDTKCRKENIEYLTKAMAAFVGRL
ncbi:MAG: M28 family peptidase [Lachnospiraceae bacterium]|nr:M28 family peptidase [Lachnospiraceae bacterium]